MPAPRLLASAVALLVTIPAAAQPPADRVPVLKPLWKFGTARAPDAEASRRPGAGQIADWLAKFYDQAIADRKAAGRPLIPPFVPHVSEPWLIYHSNEGLVAFGLGKGEFAGGEVRPGEMYWATQYAYALAQMVGEAGRRPTTNQWVSAAGSEQAWSRTLTHAIIIDRGSAFGVDDLGFLPAPPKPDVVRLFGPFMDATYANCLREFKLDTGKLRSRIGPMDVEASKIVFGKGGIEKERSVPGLRFVSVLLPSADGMTFLTERDRSLWATRFDPDRYRNVLSPLTWSDRKAHRVALSKEAVWETELMAGAASVVDDPHRRIHALHLVEAGGLVLCPTHLGRVIAVDAKTGKPKWTYEYAPLAAKRFPTFAPEWVVVPPVIADGKYIYAPADFPELLCLDPATGNKLWATQRGDGLYPAVVGDTVLVIGEKIVRGLSLKDGAGNWRVDLPGLPCGRGVALGNHYLVPVSEPKTWKGMIAVIDVKAGKVREVLKPEADEPIGNLVVHQDYLISQTLTELAVFPLKKRD